MNSMPADCPAWAVTLYDELKAIRQAISAQPSQPVQVMVSARSCDMRYRLRAGTAKAAYLAGKIRGAERPGKSLTGVVLWLRADDAETLWGAAT
jgi:hypothetical protein